MNARQAKRLALAVEGSYLVMGASTETVTERLSTDDYERFRGAQIELGYALLRRAGFSEPMLADELMASILGEAVAPLEVYAAPVCSKADG